jgi:DNA sulfur modification protein DndE
MIETIRISEKGKQQLIQLKKKTGIENWHTLCRWAFCISLAEPSIPPKEEIPADSNIEMAWKTFSQQYEEVYYVLLKQRMIDDSLPVNEENLWFRVHLHRGISFLNNSCRDLSYFTI